MKVIFIEPRGAHSNIFDKVMCIPLLGPLYLGTIARDAGYDVSIINENILRRDVRIDELECDVLCLTCLTTNIKRGREIAEMYKATYPNGKTIVGGIHASMMPCDVSNAFDQVVVGEGEDVILDVLGGKITDKIVYTKMPTDLDRFPLPDFTLIKDYKNISVWPSMASRGCPYDCNFCSVTEMFGRGYRAASPERVIEDVIRHKKGHIFFSDDHFAANMPRTERIMGLIKESGIKLNWSAQVRTNVTKDERFVARMKDANCSTVYIGFESINPKSLIDFNKGQTVDDIKRSIRVFHDNGIKVHGMFMLGSDSDTKDSFRMTSDFCNDNEIDFVQFSVLTPLPGTRTYFGLERQGRLLHKNWEYYDGLHAVFKPKNMTAEELQNGMVECFSDFYSYTNAFNNALNALADSAVVSVKKAYTRAHFPSSKPILMKIKGKEILNSWLSHNRPYMDYLKSISIRNYSIND